MSTRTARSVSRTQIAESLARPGGRFVVTSHHNPDGDAIGSLLGLARALRAAGHDVVMAHPDTDPVPEELAFLLTPGDEILAAPPADLGTRTLVAVDCASELRLWGEPLHEGAAEIVNIDHHQDNTLFGDLNLIEAGASSTAEVIAGVIEAAGWPLSRAIAEPLYVGMVTDTGRFGYTNTGAATHRWAARLIEAGADVAAISRHLYEEQPLHRLMLIGRALSKVRRLAGGRMLAVLLTQEDFDAAGGDDTEGIVEVMRSIRGVEAAALVREAGPPGSLRVSLRAADPDVDVSVIAREGGGGGHRAAAGFSSTLPPEDLLEWIGRRMTERLDARGAGG